MCFFMTCYFNFLTFSLSFFVPVIVNGRTELSNDGKTLTIHDAQKDTDICNYQCSVSNDQGEIFADAAFNVICKYIFLSLIQFNEVPTKHTTKYTICNKEFMKILNRLILLIEHKMAKDTFNSTL